ncbi:uncharacterized protein LOC113104807, partial [Carassius auratus]|uniref:Uncharacterized protein LOC113104807 n=1 Tax=Carassius auratus TaxID=7957 RepID=A0A6P6PME2_CARAU
MNDELSSDDVLSRHATAIVMTAREKHHLSQSGVNDVVAEVQAYQAQLLNSLRSQLQTVFNRHAGSELQREALGLFDSFKDPFAAVSTSYRQDSVIKEKFNFVEAEEVSVGLAVCRQKRKKQRDLAIKNKCFHYIPLIKSLEQLMSHPKIFAMINGGSQKCSSGYFYDIIDGELMLSHPLFSSRPSALQIILYLDEIEICNPLGSQASKNKLLMFYYTLGNINPKYRSKLASIRLLAIAKQSELSECGVDAILQDCMRTL